MQLCARAELINPRGTSEAQGHSASEIQDRISKHSCFSVTSELWCAVPDKIYGVSAAAHTARALFWSEDLCWPTLSLLTGRGEKIPQSTFSHSKIKVLHILSSASRFKKVESSL